MSRKKTLVVDDEADLADIAAELLTYHGIDVLVAYSGKEALQLLTVHPDIDAMFSDVMMPSMTGIELAHTVAQAYPSVRIVLTSGFTARDLWERQHGRYRFVAKPYSIDTVVHLLGA